MTNVAVLGSSASAALLATVLAEDPSVQSVSRGTQANAQAALAEADIAVGIGPTDPASEQRAALAATGAGVPYVSAAGSPDVVQALKELNRRLESDGSLVVAGMSWTPGTTNMMMAHAAAELDEVSSAEVSWVVSSDGPMASAALAMAAEHFFGSAYLLEGGALRVKSAGSDPKIVFFPEPIGWKRVRIARNAEALMTEREGPGPRSLVVRAALTSAAADVAVRALPPAARSADAAKKPRALRVVSKLAPGGPWSGLRVDVSGRKDGAATTVTCGLADQLPNLSVNPALVAVQLLMRSRPDASGVVAPDAIFDPKRYLAELGGRGVRVATLQRAN